MKLTGQVCYLILIFVLYVYHIAIDWQRLIDLVQPKYFPDAIDMSKLYFEAGIWVIQTY